MLTALLLTRALTVLPPDRRATSGTVRLDAPASAVRSASMRPGKRSARPSAPVSARPSAPARASQTEALPPLNDATSQHKLLKATWSSIELMVERRQYEEALQAALDALKAGEPLPEHQALLGWIVYQHSGAGEQAHPKVWSMFARALRRDPLCEKALYYKALVLKRTGRPDQACAHLERLLLINPKHIEAVREVRLHKMRSRRQSSGLRRLFPGSNDE
jgi:tetratricopeptide (TPR) repeat protein